MDEERDVFDGADEDGFNQLLGASFIRFGEMLFLKRRFKPNEIAKRLKVEDCTQVQREVNHTHLILYSGDAGKQREWADELTRVWKDRLETEYPDLLIHVIAEHAREESMVTFYADCSS